MSEEHPNAALVRRVFAAFGKDAMAVSAAFARDIVWRVPGHTVMSGEYRGRREVVATVEPDHARRVRGGRHLGQKRRLDVLTGDEQLDRFGWNHPHREPALTHREHQEVTIDQPSVARS